MGFCMGGALTIIAGVKIPELDAGVCFYGIPPTEAADPRHLHIHCKGILPARTIGVRRRQ